MHLMTLFGDCVPVVLKIFNSRVSQTVVPAFLAVKGKVVPEFN
jgi:hypothetical protein